ncbi:MAG: RDD family protein [Bryobacteraceae bacterium]|nr:RDD family protein [Bryobacteraceae bacterium]
MFCTKCGAATSETSAFCPSCGAPLPPPDLPPKFFEAAEPPPQAPMPMAYAPVMDYAAWGTRAIGYIIDSLLVAGVMIALYLVAGGMAAALSGIVGDDAAAGTCCMLFLLFPIATILVGLYNRVYLVSQRGYSIGQGVVKVKVVDASGRLLSQGTALVRLVAQVAMGLVPVLPVLDLLWPLWDPQRQTLHDKAVNCYVINNPQ